MRKPNFDRHVPVSIDKLEQFPQYNACKSKLVKAGWHVFFAKFQGYDDAVTLQFARGFDGKTARVGDLTMAVNDKTISRATRLLLEEDKWYKNKSFDK